MDKNEAREIAKSNLAKLSDMQRATLMQQITSTVTALPAWQEASSVALTLSQDVELPTQLLIQTALLQGKKVYLPKVAPQRQLEFIQIDESTKYERHRFGMLEPIGEQKCYDIQTELGSCVIMQHKFIGTVLTR